jgi:hypothetical protein
MQKAQSECWSALISVAGSAGFLFLFNLKLFLFWDLIVLYTVHRISHREFMWHRQILWPLPMGGNYVTRGGNLVLLNLRSQCGIRCAFTPKVSWRILTTAGLLNLKCAVHSVPDLK